MASRQSRSGSKELKPSHPGRTTTAKASETASKTPRAGRHVFISYARKDKKVAEGLFRDLRNSGFKIWVDERSLPGGATWRLEIERAIRGATSFVLLLSPNSVKSREVRKELRLALNSGVRVIPTFIDPTPLPAAVAKPLHGLHMIRLTSYRHESVGYLLEALGGPAAGKPTYQSRAFRENIQFMKAALAFLYDAAHDGGNLILRGGREFSHYVQFAVDRASPSVYAEASGNSNLSPSAKLKKEDFDALSELGWEPPGGKSSGNLRRRCRIDSDQERDAAARHVMEAFLRAFGHYPGELLKAQIQLN